MEIALAAGGAAASASLDPYRSSSSSLLCSKLMLIPPSSVPLSISHSPKTIIPITRRRWLSKLRTLASSSNKCYWNQDSKTTTTIIDSNNKQNPRISVSDQLLVDDGERIISAEDGDADEEYWINEVGHGGRDNKKKKKIGHCNDDDEEAMAAGLVKRLECLEEEALRMGKDGNNDDDDHEGGREPTDYNRRAQIFDKCSQVFQALALKNHRSTSTT